MRGRPRVSIVVTSYNYDRFVGIAIASALAQSYAATEVIVVDDGSTDRSRDIIAKFGDRIRPVFQTNGGETAATNAGFAAARGDILVFLDSDDALRANAVETIVREWRPTVVAAQWPVRPIDAAGRGYGDPFPKFRKGRTPAQVRREMLRCGLYSCSPTSGCAYAREFLGRLLPLPTEIFRHGPDGPLNTVAPLYGEVMTIEQSLSFYRIHGGNMWAQQELRPGDFARYITDDQEKVAYLRRHAAALGIALPADVLDRAFFHLQYRMASRKLCPERHPVAGDHPAGLLWRACRAVFASRDAAASRIAALVWLTALALAPPALAERLTTIRFIGERRPTVLVAAMKWAGIIRRVASVGASQSLFLVLDFSPAFEIAT
jgi:glycosyltransferase involved in cell wall biosynthesis